MTFSCLLWEGASTTIIKPQPALCLFPDSTTMSSRRRATVDFGGGPPVATRGGPMAGCPAGQRRLAGGKSYPAALRRPAGGKTLQRSYGGEPVATLQQFRWLYSCTMGHLNSILLHQRYLVCVSHQKLTQIVVM